MIIECPSCHFSAQVDSARIPPGGATTRCPKCATSFRVTPATPESSANQSEKVTCHACGAWQDTAVQCGLCGAHLEGETSQLSSESGRVPQPGTAQAPHVTARQNSFRFGNGRKELITWVSEGHISEDNFLQAMQCAGSIPDRVAWRRFLDQLTLWLGVLFLAAAVIFFFAYNWQALGHLARFGIVETLLAGAVAAAWHLGVARTVGKAALLGAALLVGALLALVGQTYQTGADPWGLFAGWAICILPWVAIARFAPLWLVLLALMNLAVGLYFQAFAGFFGVLFSTDTLWWTLAGLNTTALAIWEFAANRTIEWLAERWAPRIVATAALGFLTLVVGGAIFDRQSSGFLDFICYCGWLGGGIRGVPLHHSRFICSGTRGTQCGDY